MNVAKIEKLLWPAGRAGAPVVVTAKADRKAEEIKNLCEALDNGGLAHVSRDVWHKIIEKRAEKIREAGETREQAYSRAIETDEISKICLKAYMNPRCVWRRRILSMLKWNRLIAKSAKSSRNCLHAAMRRMWLQRSRK